jgi:hypothetical protein
MTVERNVSTSTRVAQQRSRSNYTSNSKYIKCRCMCIMYAHTNDVCTHIVVNVRM